MKTAKHEIERTLALARLDVPDAPARERILSAARAHLDATEEALGWMPVLRFACCACACLWLALALPGHSGEDSLGLPPLPATASPFSKIRRPSPTAARDLSRWTHTQHEMLTSHPSPRSL